jgi:Sulfatase
MSDDTSMSTKPGDGQSANRSRPLIFWVLPLVGATIVPGLSWIRADSPFAFRPDLVATMTAIVSVFALTLALILSKGFRSRVRWSLGVTAVVVLVGFQWDVMAAIGDLVANALGLAFLADIVPVAFAGTLLWLAVRLGGEWFFVMILTTAIAGIVGVLAVANYSVTAPAPLALATVEASPGSPDVLLLVLDGYGRADLLQDNFGYDNSPFLEGLTERGFLIASQATANYSYTYASLSTMLNLDYVFLPGDIEETERELMRAALTGAIGIVPAFKRAGYDVTYFENAWGGSLCGSAIDVCVRNGLFRRGVWNVSQLTILAPLFESVMDNPFTQLSADQLASLGSVISRPRDDTRPRFTIAHILLPHSPILLGSDCSMRAPDLLRVWGPGRPETQIARRVNYVEQVECVNQGVLTALDEFLAASPDGIVMISADHGPASTLFNDVPADEQSAATIRERMTLLSAYRLPGCEGALRQDLTPVNGARSLVNCALGTRLPPVSDVNYWITLDSDGELVELSSEVR